MAYIRKLPSGLYQATVRGPDGKRHSRTHRLKSVVDKWARQQEVARDSGEWRDPRAGHITLAAWHEKWRAGRQVEPITEAQDASTWRKHVQPQWGTWKLDAIGVEDVKAWMVRMTKDGVGPHARTKALNYLSAMLGDAVTARRLLFNPCREVERPRTPLRTPFFWTAAERDAILRALDGADRTLADLAMHAGLRPGEVYGLPAGAVDWERGLIHVTQVQTRRGIKPYPKSKKSHRAVPIPPHLVDPLYQLVVGRDPNALVFTSPKGGPIDDGHWRTRVLDPAIARARLCGHPAAEDDRDGCRADGCGKREHLVRRGTPHDMRHTAASHLVMAGVDLYRVQELLGHESFQTTQRYGHLGPDKFDKILDVWKTTAPGPVFEGRDAPVTHEAPPR